METILVSGASGYIASRLIPRLLEAGYRVRCLARQPERLRRRVWFNQVESVAGDLTRPESLRAALSGVQACYYLVHSMAAGHGYEELDLHSARNFARAAKEAGVEQIIYLGGLADESEQLAAHLRSRIESGAALREAGVPVTELRAGVIVGPGSVSFEMIRFIAEQFPLMVGPAWARHSSQPIATENVLDYLVAALTTPACRGRIIEIGGKDVMTYAESMSRFAELRGLKRGMLLVPGIPAWLMAFFIDKLTPVHNSYALPLVEGLRNNSLVLHPSARELFPAIAPLGYAEAVRRALAELRPETVERIWLDLERDEVGIKHEGMFIDSLRLHSNAPAEDVLGAVHDREWRRDWASRLRGLLPGRLDCYVVETQDEAGLRLRADVDGPSQAWLEWAIAPDSAGGWALEQTVFFAPKGLPGFLYWYLLEPLRRAALRRLARDVVRKAEEA